MAAQNSAVARIPIQVVAGKLLVRCDLSTSERRIPVNLFVELETKCGLELHNQAAAGLRAERQDGTTRPITDSLRRARPGGRATRTRRRGVPRRVHEVELDRHGRDGRRGQDRFPDLEGLAPDLRPACGSARAARARGSERHACASVQRRGRVADLRDQRSGLDDRAGWPTARRGRWRSEPSRTTRRSTRTCARPGAFPAGDVGEVRLGELRVDEFVAFRPVELNQVHVDGALGVLGLNFLEHFRVALDPRQRVRTTDADRAGGIPERRSRVLPCDGGGGRRAAPRVPQGSRGDAPLARGGTAPARPGDRLRRYGRRVHDRADLDRQDDTRGPALHLVPRSDEAALRGQPA